MENGVDSLDYDEFVKAGGRGEGVWSWEQVFVAGHDRQGTRAVGDIIAAGKQ